MERNFNIAEILKNKPKGTKLYADAFGELSIEKICTEDNIGITLSDNGGTDWLFYNDGKYSWRGESILVPSKEMRDWNKFAWKKGDVLVNSIGLKILFDRWANDKYTSFYAKTINLVEDAFLDTNLHTLASEKEAKSFVKYIEEKLGGKLNLESLEIEKQPEFKDGDIAFADYGNRQDIFIVSEKTRLSEGYSSFISLDLKGLTLSMGSRTTFFKKDLCKLRLATEEEKQQLFDALAKENKAWDAEKKQIVDLKPKWTPKPFDRVITRGGDDSIWTANIFSHIDRYGQYVTIGCIGGYPYCIPYNEETAKLIGTTNNWEG